MLTYHLIESTQRLTDPNNSSKASKPNSHLQATSQLVVDAVVEMTNIVESMHQRISPVAKLTGSSQKDRTRGLTGLVYNSIRNLTELVGKGIDAPLGVISKSLDKTPINASMSALQSALNGVLGDHLLERASPLAIKMGIKKEGRELDTDELVRIVQQSKGKLVILVHGLCMNDTQWAQSGHDHGEAIANELGHTTVYLHYNTGLHISQNGESFSHLLEQIVTLFKAGNISVPLQLSVVAHSMGGLVSRSAHHHAQSQQYQWPEYFDNLVCLGTPHHGAPLEKAGNWIDLLLGFHHYTVPLTKLTQIRSAGITDLRHGNIIESDWQTRNRFDFAKDKRTPLELPKNVNCYAVATTSSTRSNKLTEQLLGDGLVPLDSALGKHQSKPFTLDFHEHYIDNDINHIELLSDRKIYDAIKRWLEKS